MGKRERWRKVKPKGANGGGRVLLETPSNRTSDTGKQSYEGGGADKESRAETEGKKLQKPIMARRRREVRLSTTVTSQGKDKNEG